MTTSRTRSTSSTSDPAESPSTETETSETTESTSPEPLQADGSEQPANADAQADGSQQSDSPAAPAEASGDSPVSASAPALDPPIVETAGDPGRDPLHIGYGETVDESAFLADAHTTSFVEITRDVVESFYYPNTKRPAQRVVFTKGQVVPRAQVEAYLAAGAVEA